MFDLTFSHLLRVLFYMMLIWKDQGKKNKHKFNGSSTSRLPFEEFNEEDGVDFDHNNGDM